MGDSNHYNAPPRWAEKLLAFYCNPDRLEEIQGDLAELFEERVEESGVTKARWFYIYDVLRCIRGYSLKRNKKFSNNMIIRNYFLIALRNLMRHKSYALINVFGLTLGIICFSLIFLFVRHEVRYDQFHEKKDQIYIVPFTWHFGVTSLPSSAATVNVGPILHTEFPQVEKYVRLKNGGRTLVNTGDFVSEEKGFLYADSTLFQIFSFDLLYGNPKKALVEPYSLILTRNMADKYFGQVTDYQALLGRLIKIDNEREYKVTGIAENAPDNSHIQFNFLASFSSLRESKGIGNFDNSMYATYILLNKNSSATELQAKIDEYILKSFEGEKPIEIGLMPLQDFYLKSYLSSRVGPVSDIKYVYIFSAIAMLILIIACINYMNLSTARSLERAKEVGVRKVMGAFRRQLTIQFLAESLLLTFVSILVAILAINAIMPFFNYLSQKQLIFNIFNDYELLLTYAMLLFGVTLMAGFYPALALSGFSPVAVLRGRFRNSSQGARLRRVLVIFQFSISIILIVGTIVIHKQLDYVQNKNLGYNSEHIISLPFDEVIETKLDYFKTELTTYPEIKYITATSELPSKVTFETTFAITEDKENRQLMRAIGVEKDFIPTMGLQLLAGEGFTASNVKGEYAFTINEEVCNFFGWNISEAVGQRMQIWGGEWGTVVGVVKNFHFSSMHESIKPLVIFANEEPPLARNVLIRTNGDDMNKTIALLETFWVKTFDHRPFEYYFLDGSFDRLYKTEARLGQLFSTFATLAIVIGCLGLLGLMSYTAFQRSKEIGIRKVMGASATNIVILITKSFSKQVIIALIIALPLAYWIMERWLEGFAYRIDISWDILLLAGIGTIFVALVTVGYNVLSASRRNPVDTLRVE